jgi:hypothetical protein
MVLGYKSIRKNPLMSFYRLSIIPMYCFNFNNSKQNVKGPAIINFFVVCDAKNNYDENVILVIRTISKLIDALEAHEKRFYIVLFLVFCFE